MDDVISIHQNNSDKSCAATVFIREIGGTAKVGGTAGAAEDPGPSQKKVL